jgi:hypothetical protein
MKKIFLLLSLLHLSYAENLNTPKPLAEKNIVLIGPETLRLKDSLTISAEKVILNGIIYTEGFELTIIARILEVKENAAIITFENPQKSQSAAPSKLLSPSEPGQEIKGTDGLNGTKGFNGYDGQIQPGAIRIFAGIVHNKLNVNANGQKGGTGGTGQPGQDGGPGGPGRNAQKDWTGIAFKNGPGSGAPGGAAGQGGPGAEGGAGGRAAPVEIHYGKSFTEEKNKAIIVTNEPGEGGKGGEPGANGNSGPGGRGGGGAKILFDLISTGEGEQGEKKEELATPNKTGSQGAKGSFESSLVVHATFEKIMNAYMKAHVLNEVVNQSRKIDSFVRDLIVTTENNFSKENLLSRIQLLQKETEKLKNQTLIKTQNTQVLDKLESVVKSIGNSKTISTVEVQKLNSLSKKNIDKTHEQAFESMKIVCKEIINLKKDIKYDSLEIVANSAYKIFGPAALEDWVIRNEIAGTRESLLLLHKIKPNIIGANNSYPIKTINEAEINELTKSKELKNVLP